MFQILNLLADQSVHPNGLPTVGTGPGAIVNLMQIVFGVVGALAFLMIVVSGLRYITSAGNPEKTSQAKEGIITALIGLIIAITAEAIVAFVGKQL